MKNVFKKMVFVFAACSSLSVFGYLVLDKSYRAHLDFPLYKNESYKGGTRAAEFADFMEVALRMIDVQKILAEKNKQNLQRVFHAKELACVTGKLKLFRDRPYDQHHRTFKGIFDISKKDTYDIVVRYSNGLGFKQSDGAPDVRGMAVKIFGVYNNETGKEQNMDLTMTNSPTPFGRDTEEFVTFMEKVVKFGPTLGGAVFTALHPTAGSHLLKTTGAVPYGLDMAPTLASTRFWGGHAYLLGKDDAMKFNVTPQTKELSKVYNGKVVTTKIIEAIRNNTPSLHFRAMGSFDGYGDDQGYTSFEDYLSKELFEKLSEQDIKYTLNLQLETNDPRKTPIEDNNKEWKEQDTPSIPVGEIILEEGFSYNDCDKLRFTPGNYIPEHRPLSNMGRGRLFAYDASQHGRNAPVVEPDASFVEKLRQQRARERAGIVFEQRPSKK